jgi:AcrR family transcriptional regulator
MPRSKSASRAVPIGLREQNKIDKRQRIVAAARELFTRHGYTAATMRQIASRAHVGLGTLFSYADDKRDLVFLIFNDELDALTDRALASVRPGRPLVETLAAVFGAHYEHLARNPVMSRLALQELTFYYEGKQSETFHSIRARLIAGIESAVADAQGRGEIRDDTDAATISRYIFFLYSAAIRWWIAMPDPKPADGIADLRRLLSLQLEGLATRGAAPPRTKVARLPVGRRRVA